MFASTYWQAVPIGRYALTHQHCFQSKGCQRSLVLRWAAQGQTENVRRMERRWARGAWGEEGRMECVTVPGEGRISGRGLCLILTSFPGLATLHRAAQICTSDLVYTKMFILQNRHTDVPATNQTSVRLFNGMFWLPKLDWKQFKTLQHRWCWGSEK